MSLKDEIVQYVYNSDLNIKKNELINKLLESGNTNESIVKEIEILVKNDIVELFNKDKNKYISKGKNNVIGEIQGNEKGFAFLINTDGNDIYISRENLNNALHNDKVLVKKTNEKKDNNKEEGKVIYIIERGIKSIVGTFKKYKNSCFVLPDDKRFFMDIFIPKGKSLNANNDDKVIVEIYKFPDNGKKPEAKVVKIIGNKNEVGVDILSIIYKYNIPIEFPKEVLQESNAIEKKIRFDEKDNRKDLRDLFTVTIDGPDSKDFDDAISIEEEGDNFRLYVHIADVSHYIEEGSYLDEEAKKRGNSVYVLDRVVPMLPERLSNGICSLNPNSDRLTKTAEILFDNRGRVISFSLYKSYINCNYRLIYDDVSDYLEDKNNIFTDKILLEKFCIMKDLSIVLEKLRKLRGSLDFNFVETKIILNNKNKPIKILPVERRIANKIIEEFMLATNESIGKFFNELNIPFVYRIHENPDANKVEVLKRLIASLGYKIKGNKIYSKDFQKILEEGKGRAEEELINLVLLRTLKKAKYSSISDIHFGLAVKDYSHFTSPIRRYADLYNHRIIDLYLDKNFKAIKKIDIDKIDETCKYISNTEVIAEQIEREVIEVKEAEYMKKYVGEEFKGKISSLTNFGIFIKLDNMVEGLVRFRNMENDYYYFNEEQYKVLGERSGICYRLGDEVTIQVSNVNVEESEIDFILV